MKKLILISIILIFCANVQPSTAQNINTINDSILLKCFEKNDDYQSQIFAYCGDTATQKKKASMSKDDRKKVREMLETQKKEYFTKEMNLTDDEAKIFFPVLEQFENKHRRIIHERKKLSSNFEIEKNEITDAQAKQINKQWFDLQKQEFDLMLEYMKIFETILSPKKLFLFHKAHEDFMRGLIKGMGSNKDKNKNFPQNINGKL
ncbi:MAG: hypothetical protein LBC68_04240 [Prevotellaceae bacterium]|jgi:hypothetical protein|nr:hypothetical protein [Prevotellaceae bacterium]